MSEQIGSGTAQGIIDYLDSLVEKGRSRPGVVNPLKTALTKVLEVTEGAGWGATDVTNLDIDDVMSRFKNKTLSKYTTASYDAYQSRITRVVGWYKNFLANPGWVPKETVRSSKAEAKSTSKTTPQPVQSQTQAHSDSHTVAAPVYQEAPKLDAIAYPFPLANGETARIYMPKGITKADVDRLSIFLEALVISPVSREE